MRLPERRSERVTNSFNRVGSFRCALLREVLLLVVNSLSLLSKFAPEASAVAPGG